MNRHEIPTHLDRDDRLIFMLSARQALTAGAGCAVAAAVGVSVGGWAGYVAAAVCLAGAAGWTFIHPAGRPFELWLVAWAEYAARPRVVSWRPGHDRGDVDERVVEVGGGRESWD